MQNVTRDGNEMDEEQVHKDAASSKSSTEVMLNEEESTIRSENDRDEKANGNELEQDEEQGKQNREEAANAKIGVLATHPFLLGTCYHCLSTCNDIM